MFERFTCWDAAGATDILRPLALEGNEAIFRATHSPISGLVVTGTEAHEVRTATEEGVLDALSFSGRRHAMCVVEGEAGSGKSHLIRWLKVNWPTGNDLTVLIERADGTLDGTLRQLNEKLSKEAGTNLEGIVPRHKLTEQGQRVSLLLQLGNLCRAGTLAEPLGDEDWCEKHGVSDMLQSEAVRTHWRAPQRVLEVLTLGADRDSKIARFTVRDVLELMQPLAGLRGKNVGPGAIRLAQGLRNEAEAIASALENQSAGSDDADVSADAPNTTKLLAALNSRLSLAIQSAMGISGAALQKMFRDLRRALKEKGRRLVLLFEDFTGAQGIDQELLYVLQERSTTQDQFCDMVSVVGITPAYFRQHIALQANVVQRITQHVRFGKAEGSFQSVSGLEDPVEQIAFAARYLRAIRAGTTEIDRASQEQRAVTNRCLNCPHETECHTAFGEVDGVGLYPMNAKAIVRMFSALRDPKGTMFLQTPRALIQGVLAPSISAEAAIRDGLFPVPSVETEWHPPSKREIEGLAHELIEMAPEDERERLRVTVAWWGDGGFPARGDEPGEWAGVPNGVFLAWGLSAPLGGESQVHVPAEITPAPVGVAQQPFSQPEPQPVSPKEDVSSVETSKKAPSAPVKRSPPKTKIDEQFERLRNWVKTGKIEDDGFWRDRAANFIKQLGWKDEDIPGLFARDALGEIRLQGSGKTDHRVVVIPCVTWASRGLEWSARLEYGRLSQGEHEVAVQAIGVFAQSVRRVVLRWIASRLPEVEDGTPWQFGATVVQVLLTRAWLRGETRPGAPLVEQWRTILSDDSSGGATKRPGAVAWSGAVDQLFGDFALHKRLRSLAECDEPIANVAFAAPAIRSLVEDAVFASFPENLPDQPTKTKWLTTLASSASVARKALSELPAKEVSRLRDRVSLVLSTVGTSDYTVYVARAALAFGRVRQDLPNHAAGALSEWFRLHAAKEELLKTGSGSQHERLQMFLEARPLDSLTNDAPIPVLLDQAILAPAESLEGLHSLVKDTAALVNSLVDYLAQHESAASNPQDAAAVVEFGRRISTKASELKSVLS
jgi:hypothetical protein